MPTELHIAGAGGHARVVIDAARDAGCHGVFVYDENAGHVGRLIDGVSVQVLADQSSGQGSEWHVAIGDARSRQRVISLVRAFGGKPVSVIHRLSHISGYAKLDSGSFAASGSIIAAGARVGEAVIVNHNAVVDHDCDVGDYVHIAPGAVLGGGCIIGDLTLVGSAAVILPGIKVGNGVTIGAGAVVRQDVKDGAVVVGNPTRELL